MLQGKEKMKVPIKEEWQRISEVELLTFIDPMPE